MKPDENVMFLDLNDRLSHMCQTLSYINAHIKGERIDKKDLASILCEQGSDLTMNWRKKKGEY